MMRSPVHLAGVLSVLVLALGGCYDAKEVNAFLQQRRGPVLGLEYRVYPPDVVMITSRHVAEIDKVTQEVRPDGKINVPLVGEIDVAGKTPKEIEEALTKGAKDYYEQADATVTVMQFRSQSFYVFGQVTKPGPLPWTGRDTLLDALAKSQPTELAWPERIIVVRAPDPTQGGFATSQPSTQYGLTGVHSKIPDKPRHRLTINLMAMIRYGDMANNILLKPDDVIYVQPNPFAAVGLALQSIVFPVRPVLEAVRVPAAVQNAGSNATSGQ